MHFMAASKRTICIAENYNGEDIASRSAKKRESKEALKNYGTYITNKIICMIIKRNLFFFLLFMEILGHFCFICYFFLSHIR